MANQSTKVGESDPRLAANVGGQTLTASQLADLASSAKQDEYRRAYEDQLRKRACPDCGDSGLL
jgi:hypothetical protein